MAKLDLSIVIPCATDLAIVDCIRSIHATCPDDIEIIVSLNDPTPEVRNCLKSFPEVELCEISVRHLSRAYNRGISIAGRRNILLMDSDCTFENGAIQALYNGLKTRPISKGRVVFQSNGFVSSFIAKVREFTTTDFLNAYSPPLAFRKSIIDQIGHYFFHESIPWSEDNEFNFRVKKAGLQIAAVPNAIVYHRPLSLRADVQSGFRYGLGKRITESLGIFPVTKWLALETQLKRFRKTGQVWQAKGWLASLYYLFLWRPANRFGYAWQTIKEHISNVYANRNVVIALTTPNGRVLMQQRDDKPGLRGRNQWTFPGGRARPKEPIKDAIRRELLEELEYHPPNAVLVGRIREPGQPHPYIHNVFHASLTVPADKLKVHEGQRVNAIEPEAIKALDTVPWFWQLYGSTIDTLFPGSWIPGP